MIRRTESKINEYICSYSHINHPFRLFVFFVCLYALVLCNCSKWLFFDIDRRKKRKTGEKTTTHAQLISPSSTPLPEACTILCASSSVSCEGWKRSGSSPGGFGGEEKMSRQRGRGRVFFSVCFFIITNQPSPPSASPILSPSPSPLPGNRIRRSPCAGSGEQTPRWEP